MSVSESRRGRSSIGGSGATRRGKVDSLKISALEPIKDRDTAECHLRKLQWVTKDESLDIDLLVHCLLSLAATAKEKSYKNDIRAVAIVLDELRMDEQENGLRTTVKEQIQEEMASIRQELKEAQDGIVETLEQHSRHLGNIQSSSELACQAAQIPAASEVLTQLADIKVAVSNYRDAVVVGKTLPPTQSLTPQNSAEARAQAQYENRQYQTLVDIKDIKERMALLKSSPQALQETFNSALRATHDNPPENFTSKVINRLRNGGIVVEWAGKEVVTWLKDPARREAFQAGVAPTAVVKDRGSVIIAQKVLLHFEPDNDVALREVEECSGLQPGDIRKAVWCKRMEDRSPNQRTAFVRLVLASEEAANHALAHKLVICSQRVPTFREKRNADRCYKCQLYNHFASQCKSTNDTCANCGGVHRRTDCQEKNKVHCVACKADDHPSWSRDCPTFIRKCNELDERHPENASSFFWTDQAWTRTSPPPARAPPATQGPQEKGFYSSNRTSQPFRPNMKNNTRSNGKDDVAKPPVLKESEIPGGRQSRLGEYTDRARPPHLTDSSSTTNTLEQ
jgi:hypothetical protein